MKCIIITLSIFLLAGCKSLNYINSDKEDDRDLLYNLIIGIYKSTPTIKVKTQIKYDKNALKIALANINVSDTMLIIHAASYFEKTSSVGIYSYSEAFKNFENFSNYYVIKYSNDNDRIITNEFETDFFTREKLKQQVNNFFQFSKDSFISNAFRRSSG